MNEKSRTTGVGAYLLITFGMTWGLWCIPLAFGLRLGEAAYFPFLIAGAFAPALGAVVVRKWVTREGFGDGGLRLNLRGNGRFYLVAWLMPLAVVGAIVFLAVVLRVARPDFSMERVFAKMMPGREYPLERFPLGLRFPLFGVAQGLIVALIATPVLWGEEFGWRGYLQVRLFSDRPLRAAVATGLIWGVWHYPINLQGYNFPDDPVLGLFVFPVSTVLLSIIFGWLRRKTGSVWSASLAHAATNAVGGAGTFVLFSAGPNWILTSYLGVLGWIPLGAICAWIVMSGQLSQAAGDDKKPDRESKEGVFAAG